MYFIKMNDSNLLQIHLHHQFNKVVIDLLSVDIKVEENDKTLLLISSLKKSYENLGNVFLHGNDYIDYDDVVTALLSNNLMSEANDESKEESNNLYADAYGNKSMTMQRGVEVEQNQSQVVNANSHVFTVRRKATSRKIARREKMNLRSVRLQ